MTKKTKSAEGESGEPTDETVRILYAHIRQVALANARVIFDHQKPETLLKMIQSCKELQPVDRSNDELWKTVQKVRQEVLGRKADAPVKAATTRRRKGPS